jgi:hypothetical protein
MHRLQFRQARSKDKAEHRCFAILIRLGRARSAITDHLLGLANRLPSNPPAWIFGSPVVLEHRNSLLSNVLRIAAREREVQRWDRHTVKLIQGCDPMTVPETIWAEPT